MHEAAIATQSIEICAAARPRDTPRPVAALDFEIIGTAAANGARDPDVRELDPETDA